jgi:hypothetical protein
MCKEPACNLLEAITNIPSVGFPINLNVEFVTKEFALKKSGFSSAQSRLGRIGAFFWQMVKFVQMTVYS